MSVAFLPFPTLLLNRYFGSVSVMFYAASLAATGILLGILWIYAGRGGLLRDVDARLDSYFTLRALYAPVIFLLSIPTAVAAPRAAVYTWLLVFLGSPSFDASRTGETPCPRRPAQRIEAGQS